MQWCQDCCVSMGDSTAPPFAYLPITWLNYVINPSSTSCVSFPYWNTYFFIYNQSQYVTWTFNPITTNKWGLTGRGKEEQQQQHWAERQQEESSAAESWRFFPTWLRLKNCNWFTKLPTQGMSSLKETTLSAPSLSLWQEKSESRVCRWRWKGVHMFPGRNHLAWPVGATVTTVSSSKSKSTWWQKNMKVCQSKEAWLQWLALPFQHPDGVTPWWCWFLLTLFSSPSCLSSCWLLWR